MSNLNSATKVAFVSEIDKLKAVKKLTAKICCINGCEKIGGWDDNSQNFYLKNNMCGMHNKRFRTHGDANKFITVRGENRSKNPLYNIFTLIKGRCYNENNDAFKHYGGRGILMSDEWLNDFNAFCRDMGQRPSPRHSIERRKVNEGYSKENCYWATIHKQAANKRNSNKTVGISFDKIRNKWGAYLNINGKVVFRKRFKTEQAAQVARLYAEIKYFGKPIKF